MKTATFNLENDHVKILRLLDVMEVIAQKQEINTEHLETIVSIIRNYTDGHHHNKEEKLLFPKMVEKGFSFEQEPISVMMDDHVQGRNFAKEIADSISLYKAGSQQSTTSIHKNMLGYCELLREHIGKENNVLFPMADRALSEEEQKKILNIFEKVERSFFCGSIVKEFEIQIDTLAKVYNIH